MTLPSRSLAERRARRIASLVSRRARNSAAGQASAADAPPPEPPPLAQRGVDAGAPARPQEHAQPAAARRRRRWRPRRSSRRRSWCRGLGSFAAIVARLRRRGRRLRLATSPYRGTLAKRRIKAAQRAPAGASPCYGDAPDPWTTRPPPPPPGLPPHAGRRGAARAGARPRRGGARRRHRRRRADAAATRCCRWSASAARPAASPRCRRFFAAMPADTGHGVRRRHAPVGRAREHARADPAARDPMPVQQVRRTRARSSRTTSTSSRPARRCRRPNGHLACADLTPERGRRVAVDLFFRTLADSHGPHAAAIVLSGADGDGAIGIKRIKERGGLTIAQDPSEAEHARHAALGDRDRHGRLGAAGRAEMPARLIDYHAPRARLKLPPEDGPQPAAAAAPAGRRARGRAARGAGASCARAPGATSSYYKRATILRRIARRMQVNGVDDLPAYLDFLRTHPGEAGALLQDLLISVTNFFRDRDALRRARGADPARCSTARRRPTTVRVWVPACATGEEAYSIAMLLAEHARDARRAAGAAGVRDRPRRGRRSATARDGALSGGDRRRRLARSGCAASSRASTRGYRVRREMRETVLFADARPAEGLAVLAPRPGLAAATC